MINLEYMYKKAPPPDTRSRYRKFIDDWKKRFSHALYALKGGECD